MKPLRYNYEKAPDYAKSLIKTMTKFLSIVFFILVLKSAPCIANHNNGACLINQEDPYPKWVAEQLALIDGNITLGGWKKIRPAETILLFNHNDAYIGPLSIRNWCARAEFRLDLGDGTQAIRYAFFFPPEAPETLKLPDEKEAASMLDKYCTLGLIWAQRREKSTERGKELARSVRASIDRRFGKGQTDIMTDFGRARVWSETGRWQAGASTIVSGYADRPYPPSSSKNLLAFAFLPISQLWKEFGSPKRAYVYDESEFPDARARMLISESGISGHEKELMITIIDDIEDHTKGIRPEKKQSLAERIVDALQKWSAKTNELDIRHRAAALLAGDVVLFMGIGPSDISAPETGKEARRELSELGAEFTQDLLWNRYWYTRTWLRQARELDSSGPAGDLAFRMLMEMGFDTSGTCLGGMEQFREVIEQGERYLQKKHDPADASAVELMVADAYRDIVALAKGAFPEPSYIDPRRYQGEAEKAARKAIQHYRKALKRTKYTDETMTAWGEAWRMIAGLPPIRVRYLCVHT